MTLAVAREKLHSGEQSTLDNCEYVVGGYSLSSLLNYPVFVATNVQNGTYVYVHHIRFTFVASGYPFQIYVAQNAIAPAASPTFETNFQNKKVVSQSNTIGMVFTAGEITPAQYSAGIYGKSLYTYYALANTNEEIHLEDSPILLGTDPVTGLQSSIICVMKNANSLLTVSLDVKQVL